MKTIKIADIKVKATDENLLPTAEVAKLYGVDPSTIRSHKKLHSDELIEDKHFIETKNKLNKIATLWTLEGVYMLGFFIKSERAKKYRKAVAKLLTEIKKGNIEVSKAQQPLPSNQTIEELIKRTDIVRGYQGQIAKLENELAEMKSELINLKSLPTTPIYQRVGEVLIEELQKLSQTYERVEKLNKQIDKSFKVIIEIISNEPKDIPLSNIIKVGKVAIFKKSKQLPNKGE